jgi:spermidine synthase
VASFFYEVAWIRMLALLLGGATHAFELMLAAFILGLALGAFWVRTRTDRWNAIPALGYIQIAMGAAALLALPVYAQAFDWMVGLLGAFARTDGGYAWFAVARFALCLAIMLPATFCAGMTLPLITRALLERGVGEGAIGRVYGVNTTGSIAGVILAGLVLLPLIGLKHTLVAGAAVDIGFGALVLLTLPSALPGRLRYAGPVAGAGLVLLAVLLPDFDRQLVTSGVYRNGALPPPGETLFYQDGRTATVTAFRPGGFGVTLVSTNGKPDASLPDVWKAPCRAGTPAQPIDSDVATQTLAPLIALAHAPDARRVAVVGLGSGISSHVLLGVESIERLTTVEIEPAMARAARAFLPANQRLYHDPRSEMVFDDARAYFAARPDRFDLIFSEPSNPWVSGVSSLFTTEFYRRISRHLSEQGVFGQWLHLYELNDELVLSVLAAIHANFPSYAVFQSWEADLLIVAGNRETLPAPSWEVLASPGLAADLCHAVPLTPAMMEAARLIDRRALAPLLDAWGGGNSDFYPVLDLGAERARFVRRSARGFVQLAASRFDLAAVLAGTRRAPATDTIAPVPRIARMQAQAMAASLRAPAPAAPPPGDARSRARHAYERWSASLTDRRGPADWGAWLADFTVIESLVHGAAQGTVEVPFYTEVRGYMDRWNAPPGVRDVVELRRAAAAWDFPAAITRSAALMESVLAGQALISPDDFLDIAVAARIRAGDAAGARTVFQRLLPRGTRRPDDLRLLLLGAHVLQASGTGDRAGSVTR